MIKTLRNLLKQDIIASENKERKARDFVDYIKAGGCKEKQIINI